MRVDIDAGYLMLAQRIAAARARGPPATPLGRSLAAAGDAAELSRKWVAGPACAGPGSGFARSVLGELGCAQPCVGHQPPLGPASLAAPTRRRRHPTQLISHPPSLFSLSSITLSPPRLQVTCRKLLPDIIARSTMTMRSFVTA